MGCGKKQVQLKLHGRGVFFPQTIPDSNHFCSTHIEQWDSSVLLNPLIVGQRLTFGLQKSDVTAVLTQQPLINCHPWLAPIQLSQTIVIVTRFLLDCLQFLSSQCSWLIHISWLWIVISIPSQLQSQAAPATGLLMLS
ncbi:hypothetical protein RRG08_000946 [Elysia crispata]|uniref:Uncharacterized protein n=1 Tax=Elysia crispata TaxID=231223 RepID=A0AAE1AF39_9GAST|nr:hypothetical protein RRG08_000946 [Elysia crispata]